MNRIRLIFSVTAFLLAIGLGTGTVYCRHASAATADSSQTASPRPYPNFELDVLVNGRPLQNTMQGAEPTSKRFKALSMNCGCGTRHLIAWL